jgi:WD40 repeat protein
MHQCTHWLFTNTPTHSASAPSAHCAPFVAAMRPSMQCRRRVEHPAGHLDGTLCLWDLRQSRAGSAPLSEARSRNSSSRSLRHVPQHCTALHITVCHPPFILHISLTCVPSLIQELLPCCGVMCNCMAAHTPTTNNPKHKGIQSAPVHSSLPHYLLMHFWPPLPHVSLPPCLPAFLLAALAQMRDHPQAILCLAPTYQPDKLLSACRDSQLRLWDFRVMATEQVGRKLPQCVVTLQPVSRAVEMHCCCYCWCCWCCWCCCCCCCCCCC